VHVILCHIIHFVLPVKLSCDNWRTVELFVERYIRSPLRDCCSRHWCVTTEPSWQWENNTRPLLLLLLLRILHADDLNACANTQIFINL